MAKDRLLQNNFYGCIFINAIREYSEQGTAIREICREYKRLMKDYMIKLAKDAEAKEPEKLGTELALLFEGSIVAAQVLVEEREKTANTAKRIANILIDEQCL